jgi:WD40 repeat protein
VLVIDLQLKIVLFSLLNKNATAISLPDPHHGNTFLVASGTEADGYVVEEVALFHCSPLCSVQAHSAPITSCAFVQNSEQIVTTSSLGEVKVWSVTELMDSYKKEAHKNIPEVEIIKPPTLQSPTSLSPVAPQDKGLPLHHLEQMIANASTECLTFSDSPVTALCLTERGGKQLFCGYLDGSVVAFHFKGSLSVVLRDKKDHLAAVRAICPVYNGNALSKVLFGDEDGTICEYDWNKKTINVSMDSFSPDGISSLSLYEKGSTRLLGFTGEQFKYSNSLFIRMDDWTLRKKSPFFVSLHRATASAKLSPSCYIHGTYKGAIYLTLLSHHKSKSLSVVPAIPIGAFGDGTIRALAVGKVEKEPLVPNIGHSLTSVYNSSLFKFSFVYAIGEVVYFCDVEKLSTKLPRDSLCFAVAVHSAPVVAVALEGGVVVSADENGDILVTKICNYIHTLCHFQSGLPIRHLCVSFASKELFVGDNFGHVATFTYVPGSARSDEVIPPFYEPGSFELLNAEIADPFLKLCDCDIFKTAFTPNICDYKPLGKFVPPVPPQHGLTYGELTDIGLNFEHDEFNLF